MNAWLVFAIRKWLGLTNVVRAIDEEMASLNTDQCEHHMRLLELERQVSELKPQRDSRGRFSK